jgi:hypothetical protein
MPAEPSSTVTPGTLRTGKSTQTILAEAFFDGEEEAVSNQLAPMTEAIPVGSSGPRAPLKPKKMTVEEGRQLRESNYRLWLENLRQVKLKKTSNRVSRNPKQQFPANVY